jgi:ABC-type sugar transport system substrate-binding protein
MRRPDCCDPVLHRSGTSIVACSRAGSPLSAKADAAVAGMEADSGVHLTNHLPLNEGDGKLTHRTVRNSGPDFGAGQAPAGPACNILPKRRRRLLQVLVGSVAIALLAGACGSSASSSPATSSTSSSPATSPTGSSSASSSSGPSTAQLTSLAASAAKANGPVVSVPKETIGYLRYVAADYSDGLMYNSFVQAASVLGWKVIVCDGGGIPSQMAACMSTLVSDHPSAIVNDGIPQSLIAAGLQQARAHGITLVYTSGTLAPGSTSIDTGTNLYDAGYTTPDQQMGVDLANYMVHRLKVVSGTKQLIDQTFPLTEWGVVRDSGLQSVLQNHPDAKVVARVQADSANLVQGTNTSLSALLSQYPQAKAVWITFDGTVGGAAEAVQAKYPGKTFPNAPMILTFYDDPQTSSLISQGVVSAAANVQLQACSWIAVDQLAQFFARKTPLSPNVRPDYSRLNFFKTQIITKANVPSGNAFPAAPVNYVKYFTAKWHDEFNRS